MKTNNIYLNRLFKFYFHLGVHHSEELLVLSKGNSRVTHTSGILNLLPNVFHQWELDSSGNARLKSHPDLCTLTAAGFFFDLTVDELYNLFVPKYNERFLGGYRILHERALTKDLLANMLGLIHVKRECQAELEEEEKLNLKTKSYEKQHYRKYPVSQLWA